MSYIVNGDWTQLFSARGDISFSSALTTCTCMKRKYLTNCLAEIYHLKIVSVWMDVLHVYTCVFEISLHSVQNLYGTKASTCQQFASMFWLGSLLWLCYM